MEKVLNILRWIIFIPVAITLQITLCSIPPVVYKFASTHEFKFTLWSVIVAMVSAGVVVNLLYAFPMALFIVPFFVCNNVAPNNRIAAPIYGFIFAFIQIYNIQALVEGHVWGKLIYMLIFTAIWGYGIVLAYENKTTPSFKKKE